MNEIQEQLIDYIQKGGIDDFFRNPKNTWLIVSGEYEKQLNSFMYHSFQGGKSDNLHAETALASNLGHLHSIYPDTLQPDMTVTGTEGIIERRVILANKDLSLFSDIPAIAFIEIGHDFANNVEEHLKIMNSDYYKIMRVLLQCHAKAEGLLQIQIATEYINVSDRYSRYFNKRAKVKTGENWAKQISDSIGDIQCAKSKKIEVHRFCGLQVNVHIFFGYRTC